jgi:putative aldouronate transport system substrate-binding protein
MESTDRLLGRRHFLAGAVGAAGAAAVALAGCGGGDDNSGGDTSPTGGATGGPTGGGSSTGAGSGASSGGSSSASGGSAALPAYEPYTGVKPDLPSTSELVLPGFYAFPKDLVQFSSKPPIASGDEVSVVVNTNIAVPPPLGSNKFWQEFNKQAGADVKFTSIPEADYLPKFQTTIAGNDLPELISIRAVVGLPDLLKKRFTDLSEHLAGDNIKKYPGLANIPTISWRNSVYHGGIYTIPIPRSPVSGEMAIRLDIASARGGNPAPASYADFLALCKAVNAPNQHSWAMGSPQSTLNFIREMLGNANFWAVDDSGKFTYRAEQDTFKDALSAVASMWKDGLFHPDSYTKSNDLATWVGSGIVVMNNGGGTAGYYTTYKDAGVSPDLEMGLMVPPKYDGGGDGHKYYGTATYSLGIAFRQNKADRIEELLQFSNWLASPFGTKEYLFLTYGIENTDFTYKNGVPVKNTTGVSETALPVGYTGAPAYVNISPGHQDYTKRYYDWQQRCAKIAMTMPTLGLYSETDQGKGATLLKTLTDLSDDIITGRKKIDVWDDAVKSWRSGGGDTIRKEYETAYAAAHS